MRVFIAALVVYLVLMIGTVASASNQNPMTLYGPKIAFDVVRDGAIVGKHETRFERAESGLTVTSLMSINLSLLFFPVYEFDYQSREIWRDGKLSGLIVKVSDDGEEKTLTLSRQKDRLKRIGGQSSEDLPGDIFPTNHWNAAVLEDKQVLNTLTGNLNSVIIKKIGLEDVETRNGVLRATRYDYTGDLQDTSAWYDREGRWVKLRFKARDGSTIDYICRTCKPEGAS